MIKRFAMAICLFAAFLGAWFSTSLVNSFGATSWHYTPIPLNEPNMVFIGFCWMVALVGLMYVASRLVHRGFSKGIVCLAAATIGSIPTAAAIWIPVYCFSSGGGPKSFQEFWNLFSADGQSFLMASIVLSLFMAMIGVSFGTKAFVIPSHPDADIYSCGGAGDGDPGPKEDTVRRRSNWVVRMFNRQNFFARLTNLAS